MAPRTTTQVTHRKIAKPTDPDADVLSVSEFCRKNNISLQTFYKFIKDMPETFTIGTRRLISREAAARWRAEREAKAKGKVRETASKAASAAAT
ncbi:hypothetical protein [Bradyrhizobium sp. th.b2]|uniref:hypothetical protein n=1 Tax=Bradyrhizobium sp. th-b2 TaxID=172088 RepID=UPI000413BD3D|nr:hypothetical protein [Bradyrhizobium sp. th.b2]